MAPSTTVNRARLVGAAEHCIPWHTCGRCSTGTTSAEKMLHGLVLDAVIEQVVDVDVGVEELVGWL